MRKGYKLINILKHEREQINFENKFFSPDIERIQKEWSKDYIGAGSILKIEITENMETILFHFENGSIGRIDAYNVGSIEKPRPALILCEAIKFGNSP